MLRDNGVWAESLKKPQSALVTEGIERMTPEGIVTRDGVLHEVDIIVYATGFQASEFLEPLKITGLNGTDLHEYWGGDAKAFAGLTVPNFPNLFIITGPNTGHVVNGSLYSMIEYGVEYILESLRLIIENDLKGLDLKQEVLDEFVAGLDAANATKAWGHPSVHTWYKNKFGRVSQIWPHPVAGLLEDHPHREPRRLQPAGMSAAAAEPLAGLRAGEAVYVTEVDDGVVCVRGVRYGERLDPSDRFSALGDPSPERPQAAATVFPQSPGSLDWLLGPALSRMPQSEDSFLLDIWAPEGAKDLPVLVFLPGGAFISGAGNVRWYDGARLAREGGAVVVTVNYRLGALGLLGGAGGAGNAGARPWPRNLGAGDILQALTWIHRNIAAFGGNPGATTLAGHSAGAWYAYVLSFAEQARGLFNRTALFSLPWQPPLNAAEFAERYRLFAAALGGGDDGGDGAPESTESTATAEAVLAAQAAVSRAYAGRGLGLMPAADGELVPAWAMDFERAAAAMHVDALLLSSTDDEAAAFLHALPVPAVGPEQLAGFVGAHFEAPAEALSFIDARHPAATDHAKLVEAMSLHQFRLAATELAGRADEAGIPTTLLRFSVRSRLDGAGSPHCFELPFLFGNRAGLAGCADARGVPRRCLRRGVGPAAAAPARLRRRRRAADARGPRRAALRSEEPGAVCRDRNRRRGRRRRA